MEKKKLKLRTETLRHLRQENLRGIEGAAPPPSYNCGGTLIGPEPVKDSTNIDCGTNFCNSLYICDTFATLTSL